ncbi:MAG: hypothetical protein KC457_12470 [Myxococcales bacterium]|nr:hypothetical protein [Myxococcales bacterium]
MFRVRSFVPRLTATVTAAALCAGLSVAPQVVEASQLDQKTTFLGVEGEGEVVQSLSDALRWDLTQRGRDDGRTMTLAELKLTMGCGDADVPCFAEAGKTLNSDELVYATMTKYGEGWKIDLVLLNVLTGKIQKEVSRELTKADVSDAALAQTATSLINDLYEIVVTEDDVPPPKDDPEKDPNWDNGNEDQPKDGSKLIWGPYSPRPKWKLIGVGVTGGLTVAALGTAIGSTIAIGANGPIRKELLAAAEDSLTDLKKDGTLNTANDIDPNSNGDLCRTARTAPPGMPGTVTNKPVTEVCNKADAVAALATAGWFATGLFAIGTAAFTTLLFVHKDSSPTAAKLLEHKVQFGGTPVMGGGFVLGGSFAF